MKLNLFELKSAFAAKSFRNRHPEMQSEIRPRYPALSTYLGETSDTSAARESDSRQFAGADERLRHQGHRKLPTSGQMTTSSATDNSPRRISRVLDHSVSLVNSYEQERGQSAACSPRSRFEMVHASGQLFPLSAFRTVTWLSPHVAATDLTLRSPMACLAFRAN